MGKNYEIGDIYRPQQEVTPIANVRRGWGIITAIDKCDDCIIVEFDCGFKLGDCTNIFTEIINNKHDTYMNPTNPIQFLDFETKRTSILSANPNDCAIYKRSATNKTYQLRFPKNCESAIESGFNYLRVAINNLTNEVFFVLSKDEGLPIGKQKNAPYRVTNRELVIWLEERFSLPKNGGGVLTFSENLDRAGGFTYRVIPKKGGII